MPTPVRTEAGPAGRWGRIPAWWLDHPDLDADGLAVLAALATYADDEGVCWPSQSTLAKKLKRSRPTVNRILRRLDAIGLVAIEHRNGCDGSRLSCRYRLSLTAGMPVSAADRDDSPTDTPCPEASHQHHHPEQIPDSLPPRAAADATVGATLGARAAGDGEVPETWTPDAADRHWARTRFPDLDIDTHAETFVLRCRAHGYRYRDVAAAWRSWLVQDVAAGRHGTPSPAPATGPVRTGPTRPGGTAARAREAAGESRLAAWMTAAARLESAQTLQDVT